MGAFVVWSTWLLNPASVPKNPALLPQFQPLDRHLVGKPLATDVTPQTANAPFSIAILAVIVSVALPHAVGRTYARSGRPQMTKLLPQPANAPVP